jgi:CheY-like chemotaxis protein
MKGLLETILVVEDHDDSRRMLEDVLTQAGFRVLTATNGAEALRLLASERPDLIVLDLILPWVNGVEVLRTVRDHPPLRIVPVLVVTGTQTSEFELRTFRPVRVLRKPLNVDAVVPTIQQMLSQPSTFQS